MKLDSMVDQIGVLGVDNVVLHQEVLLDWRQAVLDGDGADVVQVFEHLKLLARPLHFRAQLVSEVVNHGLSTRN